MSFSRPWKPSTVVTSICRFFYQQEVISLIYLNQRCIKGTKNVYGSCNIEKMLFDNRFQFYDSAAKKRGIYYSPHSSL